MTKTTRRRMLLAGGSLLAASLARDNTVIDYALAEHRDDWLRHPTLGEASFDAFVHQERPILEGVPPLEWPVNPFLFIDPVSGEWYGYIGYYPAGYALKPPPAQMKVVAWHSRDRGLSWERLGPMLPSRFRLEGLAGAVTHAPDVTVVYDGGRYHMAFDFATEAFKWESEFAPSGENDSGIGYAWAESPAGPWHTGGRPLLLNSRRAPHPIAGKYARYYGPTLLRRSKDWLLLTSIDSGRFFAWGVTAATAPRPEGPWSDPVLVVSPETDHWLPTPCECFPGFAYNGVVRAPLVSVARNRNYVVQLAAGLERAHEPAAWSVECNGGLWHSQPVAWEHYGLWGQVPSMQVAGDELAALFPSRNPAGMGTVGLARRKWSQPYRASGFVTSGQDGPSLVPLAWSYGAFQLDAQLLLRGAASLFWAWAPVLGAERPVADAMPDPRCRRNHQAVEISADRWRVVTVDGAGQAAVAAEGPVRAASERTLSLHRDRDGTTLLLLDEARVWSGRLPAVSGGLALWVERGGHLTVKRFAVAGPREPVVASYLPYDAVGGAGEAWDDWKVINDPRFSGGTGLVRIKEGGRAKWNIRGTRVVLRCPKGPDGALMAVRIDGRDAGVVDTRASAPGPSAVVFDSGRLSAGNHAIALAPVRGRLILDRLEVRCA